MTAQIQIQNTKETLLDTKLFHYLKKLNPNVTEALNSLSEIAYEDNN